MRSAHYTGDERVGFLSTRMGGQSEKVVLRQCALVAGLSGCVSPPPSHLACTLQSALHYTVASLCKSRLIRMQELMQELRGPFCRVKLRERGMSVT